MCNKNKLEPQRCRMTGWMRGEERVPLSAFLYVATTLSAAKHCAEKREHRFPTCHVQEKLALSSEFSSTAIHRCSLTINPLQIMSSVCAHTFKLFQVYSISATWPALQRMWHACYLLFYCSAYHTFLFANNIINVLKCHII